MAVFWRDSEFRFAGAWYCAQVLFLVYCTIGGMWGVVLTDVIQTGIIMVGVPILAVAILIQYTKAGGSVGEIFATPFIPEGMGTQFIYLVLLPFLLSISVSYDAYARIQSAKNAKTAALGCIIGGIIVIVVGILCSMIGVAARPLFPGVTDGIFTIATMGILPPVLAGIVIAAILSAAMSSANCVILSLGSSFSRDLYNKVLHPEVENLDELPKSKLISRLTVFLGSLAGIFFAFHMTSILDAMIIFNYPYMGKSSRSAAGRTSVERSHEKRRFRCGRGRRHRGSGSVPDRNSGAVKRSDEYRSGTAFRLSCISVFLCRRQSDRQERAGGQQSAQNAVRRRNDIEKFYGRRSLYR